MTLTKAEKDQIAAVMDEYAKRLAELGCDSVTIFTTFMEKEGCTGGMHARTGNFYAQRGYMQWWLDHVSQEDMADAIGNRLEGDEE